MNLISNHLSGQEEHQGYSLLWNGQNLDGWQGVDGPEVPGQGWQFDKGVLTIDSGEEGGLILTEDQYGPFELKFDFMQHEEHGKAGINYLVSHAADTSSPETSGTYGRLTARQTEGMGEWNKGLIKFFQADWFSTGSMDTEYHLNSEKSFRGNIRLDATGSPISYRSIKLRLLD